jgi:hypothetical protein
MTLAERPDLRDQLGAPKRDDAWPEFMNHDPVADLSDNDASCWTQHIVVMTDGDDVIAKGYTIPFAFPTDGRQALPDAGWDAVIARRRRSTRSLRRETARRACLPPEISISQVPEHARLIYRSLTAASNTSSMEARDVAEPTDAAFAVVLDVAATWHDYDRTRPQTADRDVPGLIVHAAGPTSEGFRTIDVWTSRAAWQRNRHDVEPMFEGLLVPPVVRELHVDHLVCPVDRDRSADVSAGLDLDH